MDMMPLADKIKEKLAPLDASHLDIMDDSGKHAGHVGNPDGRGETHFILKVTSAAFSGKSRLERQRMVIELVAPLWENTTLHALSINARSPDDAAPAA